jgi:hypothetical protein
VRSCGMSSPFSLFFFSAFFSETTSVTLLVSHAGLPMAYRLLFYSFWFVQVYFLLISCSQ